MVLGELIRQVFVIVFPVAFSNIESEKVFQIEIFSVYLSMSQKVIEIFV